MPDTLRPLLGAAIVMLLAGCASGGVARESGTAFAPYQGVNDIKTPGASAHCNRVRSFYDEDIRQFRDSSRWPPYDTDRGRCVGRGRY